MRGSSAVIVCLLLIAFSAVARADFKSALAAYDRGDYQTAFDTWLPLARDDDPAAQRNIGHLYRQGLGVAQDFAAAAEWYARAANLGMAGAQTNLASMYLRGQGVSEDPEEAAYWFQRAAASGHILARYNLGLMYSRGIGVPQNMPRAMGWLYLAAKAGHEQAQTALSQLVLREADIHGPPPPPPGFVRHDPPAAVTADTQKSETDAADAEPPTAARPVEAEDKSMLAWLGGIFFGDDDTAKANGDVAQAHAAAAIAPRKPAVDPQTGLTPPAPPRQPVLVYVLDPPLVHQTPAAEPEPQEASDVEPATTAPTDADGVENAMNSGLTAYYTGDLNVARDRWLPIADTGHREAQYQLGLLFDRPDYAGRDRGRSFKWLRLAADQGHAEAGDQLRRLENELSPAERQDGLRLVRTWRGAR